MVRVTAEGLGAGFSAVASAGGGVAGDGAAAGGIVGAGVVDASVAVAAVPVVGMGAPVGSKVWPVPSRDGTGKAQLSSPFPAQGARRAQKGVRGEP